jgi:hypothetical protein
VNVGSLWKVATIFRILSSTNWILDFSLQKSYVLSLEREQRTEVSPRFMWTVITKLRRLLLPDRYS